jgi:hypothetical protein
MLEHGANMVRQDDLSLDLSLTPALLGAQVLQKLGIGWDLFDSFQQRKVDVDLPENVYNFIRPILGFK